jgi:hypothetical protein
METIKGRRDITMRRQTVDVGEKAVSVRYGRKSSMIDRGDVVSVDVKPNLTIIRTKKRSYRLSLRRSDGQALQRALIG